MADQLRKAVRFSPVVVLTGARQTGKSTLLREETPFKDWQYLNLDDLDLLSLAEKRPEELLALSNRLIVDEVQRSPNFLLAVKQAVDRDRTRRVVLSGSANLLLMKSVSETLAGRAVYFDLFPFSLGEEKEKAFTDWISRLPGPAFPKSLGPVEPVPEFSLFRGFLPPVTFLADEDEVAAWWQGYIRTYLERDLRDLSQISSLPDFRRLMGLLALRNGQILKQSELARDAGLSQPTTGRYINLLEISGLLVKLMPYSRNISKRIIKSPKAYWIDPGLVCALAGYRKIQGVAPSFKGPWFESLIFLNLLILARTVGGELFYFRTQGGKEREVDFILETANRVIAVEVKYADKIGMRDAENLRFLRDLLPNWGAGLIIYNGPEVKTLGENIHAVPWGMI
ncbi:MAG: ATP-binding protein [Desulfobacterota bacterium]|nr:ATP-binding protein [Thermodesulfobacteriota bacterium]